MLKKHHKMKNVRLLLLFNLSIMFTTDIYGVEEGTDHISGEQPRKRTEQTIQTQVEQKKKTTGMKNTILIFNWK